MPSRTLRHAKSSGTPSTSIPETSITTTIRRVIMFRVFVVSWFRGFVVSWLEPNVPRSLRAPRLLSLSRQVVQQLQDVREDPHRGDVGARARTLHDERRLRIALRR